MRIIYATDGISIDTFLHWTFLFKSVDGLLIIIPHLCLCCVLLSREKVWCLLPKLVNKSSSPLLPQSAEPQH